MEIDDRILVCKREDEKCIPWSISRSRGLISMPSNAHETRVMDESGIWMCVSVCAGGRFSHVPESFRSSAGTSLSSLTSSAALIVFPRLFLSRPGSEGRRHESCHLPPTVPVSLTAHHLLPIHSVGLFPSDRTREPSSGWGVRQRDDESVHQNSRSDSRFSSPREEAAHVMSGDKRLIHSLLSSTACVMPASR